MKKICYNNICDKKYDKIRKETNMKRRVLALVMLFLFIFANSKFIRRTQIFDSMENEKMNNREELFSKAIRAGKRTYEASHSQRTPSCHSSGRSTEACSTAKTKTIHIPKLVTPEILHLHSAYRQGDS